MVLLRVLVFVFAIGIFQSARTQSTEYPIAKQLARFRFEQLNGGIIMVRAALNQLPDSLNFILDTGSGGISLDTATVLEFNIPIEPSDKTVKGIGGIKPLHFYKGGTLHFPGLDVTDLDFHVNDYGILSEVYGIKIDGIIGYSFLRRYVVQVNFDDQHITVYSPGSFTYPPRGTFLNPYFTSIPITKHTVSEQTTAQGNFFFDTGAGMCLMLAEQFVKDSAFFGRRKKVVSTQVEGLVGKITMQLSVIRQVKIGKTRFRKVPVHIYNDSINLFSYPSLVGLIGGDLLRRFNLVIHYPERTIHLTPNSHFADPFDYSYTGMSLYFINGKVEVAEVQPNSPAAKAGFESGDIIFGIENNFSNNIQQYKQLLQQPGQKLRIIIYRNNLPRLLELKVANIIR